MMDRMEYLRAAAIEPGYAVNCKWRPQVKSCAEIQWLLKRGLIRQERHHYGPNNARTFIVATDKGREYLRGKP